MNGNNIAWMLLAPKPAVLQNSAAGVYLSEGRRPNIPLFHYLQGVEITRRKNGDNYCTILVAVFVTFGVGLRGVNGPFRSPFLLYMMCDRYGNNILYHTFDIPC